MLSEPARLAGFLLPVLRRSVVGGKHMPGVKGKTNNPNGRPKTRPQLTPALRAILGKKAPDGETTNRQAVAKMLVDLALAGDIQAIKLIFERVDGKVPEPLEVSGKDGESITFTIALDRPDSNDDETV